MAYKIIQPPFTLKFREMSRKELRDYDHWFFEILPERIAALAGALASRDGAAWSADFTPHSLDALGEWFAGEVETRPRTAEEIAEIQGRSEFKIDVPAVELTNRTFSLAMDVGMYLGKTLAAKHPKLKWEQPLDDPRFVDFGQPVLVGCGPAPFNPVRIATVLAYGIASGKQTGRRLREVFEYWSRQAAKAGG